MNQPGDHFCCCGKYNLSALTRQDDDGEDFREDWDPNWSSDDEREWDNDDDRDHGPDGED